MSFPRSSLLVFAFVVGCAGNDGSAENAGTSNVTDALRAEAETDLGQHVSFVVDSRRYKDGWTLAWGRPLRLDGQPMDYSGTRYVDRVKGGMFDEQVLGLFHQDTLVAWEMGPEQPRSKWLAAHGGPAELASPDDDILAAGGAERSQAMMAVRAQVEYRLGQSALVVVSSVRARVGRATLRGWAVKPDGSPLGYSVEAVLTNQDGEGWFVAEADIHEQVR